MNEDVCTHRKRLAVIPARGGSKGIPHKNIVDICGKPLIAYTIKAGLDALAVGALENLIVSTDDIEIAHISREYGAEVPFIRPAELASDNSKSVGLLIHAIDYYRTQNIYYDDVVLLQPTSPMRTGEDIVCALEVYDNNSSDSLLSCYKEEYICDLVSYYRKGNEAIPVNPLHNQGVRRQETKDLYVRNGAIYITKVSYLLESKKVFGGKIAMYVMPKERSVDVDTLYDLKLARLICSSNF